MADISDLMAAAERQEYGIEIEIKHPRTGEPLGWFVKIASAESPRAQKAVKQALRRAGKKNAAEAEMMIGEALARAIILDWRNAEMNGEPFEFNEDNLKTVLQWPWFVEQVGEAAADRDLFFGDSGATSLRSGRPSA